MILTLIRLQNEHDGMGICAKHQKYIQSGRKHHFWSFLAITIAVCQIQTILTLIRLQNEHDGWGYAQNTEILFRAEMIPRKHHFWSFLAITIPVCQIQVFNTHTSSK